MDDWYSTHVYYYDKDKDALLLDAVRPLFAAIQRVPEAPPAYFLRHWLRGPHVRINVRTNPDTWNDRVRPLIAETIGGYLRDHPSTSDLSEEQELPMHRRLADLEDERGPLSPWYPDNSVQYLPYDPRLHVLRTEQSSALLADFHVASTPLAFAVLDHVSQGQSRLEVPLRLMFATAAKGCPPIDKGYLSYRSHAEGFLANSSDPAGLRARFERAYSTNAEAMEQRLIEVLDALDDNDHEVPFVAEWVRLVDAFQHRAAELYDSGLLELQAIEAPPDDAAADPPPVGRIVSPFHRALFGNDQVRDQLNTASWFAVYRVLLNYQYLLFNRLGLVPLERFMLCYLAARTVESRYAIAIPDFLDPRQLFAPWTAGS